MEESESELLRVLVKTTDYISGTDLRKVKFMFFREIRREGRMVVLKEFESSIETKLIWHFLISM